MSRIITENSHPAEQLEKLMDSHGLRNVLLAISAICYGKSSHVSEVWQDKHLSRQWIKSGDAVERCADNGTIMRLP